MINTAVGTLPVISWLGENPYCLKSSAPSRQLVCMFVCYYKYTCISWISSVTDTTCYCQALLQSEDNSHICRHLFQTKYTYNQQNALQFLRCILFIYFIKTFNDSHSNAIFRRTNKFGPQFHLLSTVKLNLTPWL